MVAVKNFLVLGLLSSSFLLAKSSHYQKNLLELDFDIVNILTSSSVFF